MIYFNLLIVSCLFLLCSAHVVLGMSLEMGF
jgi:hypothetical protein